jgi:hypothetical protein
MAIIKTAKNIRIKVKDSYRVISGGLTKTAEYLNVESTEKNLSLCSNKNIVTNGKNK